MRRRRHSSGKPWGISRGREIGGDGARGTHSGGHGEGRGVSGVGRLEMLGQRLVIPSWAEETVWSLDMLRQRRATLRWEKHLMQVWVQSKTMGEGAETGGKGEAIESEKSEVVKNK